MIVKAPNPIQNIKQTCGDFFTRAAKHKGVSNFTEKHHQKVKRGYLNIY